VEHVAGHVEVRDEARRPASARPRAAPG
jgi:hypothetical protein